MFEISVKRRFTADHALFTAAGPIEERHTHDFQCELAIEAPRLSDGGMAADFRGVDAALDSVLRNIEGADLNGSPLMEGLSPSAENMALVIHRALAEKMPAGARLSRVTVWEDERHAATYFERL